MYQLQMPATMQIVEEVDHSPSGGGATKLYAYFLLKRDDGSPWHPGVGSPHAWLSGKTPMQPESDGTIHDFHDTKVETIPPGSPLHDGAVDALHTALKFECHDRGADGMPVTVNCIGVAA